MIYRLKPGMKKQIKKVMKIYELAEVVGVGSCYMSEVLNNRRRFSKTLAYSICKAISPDLEIKDLFDIIEE